MKGFDETTLLTANSQPLEELLEQLPSCPLDQLYRLKAAIEKEIFHPDRIAKLKQSFRVGERLSIYHPQTHQILQVIVCKKNPKYVVVQLLDSKAYWKVPYHLISTDTTVATQRQTQPTGKPVDRNQLMVGDQVAFRHEGEEHFAIIERLNQKSTSVRTTKGKPWRVSYDALYHVNIVDQEQAVDISSADYHILPSDDSGP